MKNFKRTATPLLVALLASGIFASNGWAASQFSVLMWQNMSLPGDMGTSSGYTNNTFIAVIGSCLEILDDACISKVESRKDINSPWVSMKPKTMTYEEAVCRGCTGQTYGIWKRDKRGLPTGNLPSRWSSDDVSVIVQSEIYGKYWQGKEIFKPIWSDPETSFLVNGMSVRINSSKLHEMSERDFRISIDLKDRREAATGFFDGRMRDTNIQITKDGNLVVQGKPVVVSAARSKIWNNSDIPDDVIDLFKGIYVEGAWIGIPRPALWKTSSTQLGFSFGNYMNNDFPKFEFFEKYFDPKRTEDVGAWSISNSNWATFQGVDPCFKTGETSGVATTNANMYTTGLPTWDKENGTLDFRMASPHLMASEKLTTGNYDLVLNESVAKCIWGISEIPTTATLNITYPDGTSEAAVVTLQVREGFVNFHASGFHFSAPTVKIKLNSPKPFASPIPTISSAPTESKAAENSGTIPTKTISIKCNNGKKVIIKTGKKPTCPYGYKRIR